MFYLIFTLSSSVPFFFFFFNDTATTEIYTLSLHDALPIYPRPGHARAAARHHGPDWLRGRGFVVRHGRQPVHRVRPHRPGARSEEHTSELQSRQYLVCRLLLEKKKKYKNLLYIKSLN